VDAPAERLARVENVGSNMRLCVSLSLTVNLAIHCLSVDLCLSPEFSAGILCLCSLSLHICSMCSTSR
jgi:hypothetical protein